MRYAKIVQGTFLSRPNRFIAQVKIGDAVHTVHVKNTGRCRELLIPGVKVVLEYHPDAKALGRKTEYSLVGVYKAGEEGGPDRLVNMDSQAPNQAAKEWLEAGGLERENRGPDGMERESREADEPEKESQRPDGPESERPEPGNRRVCNIRREVTYGQSRFDLAFEMDGKPAFMEVKGVTLEDHGIAMFPDAPTERGVKHLEELADAAAHGFQAYILFVIQMKGVHKFMPNWKTHEAFARTLKEVSQKGVKVLAYDCLVREDGFRIHQPVPVVLEREE